MNDKEPKKEQSKRYFDVDNSTKYGRNVAEILNYIAFCVKVNESKDQNNINGEHWFYCTARQFHEKFPYITERQIGTAISKMQQKGLILVGNYNRTKNDRTKWYTLTELGKNESNYNSISLDSKAVNNKGNSKTYENGNDKFEQDSMFIDARAKILGSKM